MLNRMQIRRYLMALLWSEMVQSPTCEPELLYQNCDGERPDIHDSPTQQLFENVEGSLPYDNANVAIAFGVIGENYTFDRTSIDKNSITFWIDIACMSSSGSKREDILTLVQERILYRLLKQQTFQDAMTKEDLIPFLSSSKNVQMSVRDDSETDGRYTVRQLTFVIDTTECIETVNCDDEPICFDFTNLTKNIGGCNG